MPGSIKFFTFALTALFAVPSHGWADTCDFGEPHPGAPKELEQYDFIIGNYTVKIRVWTGEGWSEQFQKARWIGRYILQGRAVMEEWFPFDPEDKPDTPGGVNIRMYDPEEGLWKLMWMHTENLVPTELRSQIKDDGNMYLWRVYPTPDDRKIYFESYDADNWARFDYFKDESGENWIPKYKFEAHRIPCE